MKTLHLWRGDELFEIKFQFKWKQPATKISSEIFFFKNLLKNSCKKILYVSAVNFYLTYIFKRSNYRFFGLLFKTYFKNSYFDTSISNYSLIELLEFFLYWFYMCSLYNFIFQRLISKMINVHFIWFGYWILKEWKTAKVQNHSVPAY